MTTTAPRPSIAGVHFRGRAAAAALAIVLAVAPAHAVPGGGSGDRKAAPAGDDAKEPRAGKDGEPDGKKADADGDAAKKEPTAEKRVLAELGKAWKTGDVKVLAARLPKRRKVDLHLSKDADGSYRREQARSLLTAHFAGRTGIEVELESVRKTVGTFAVTVVRRRDRRRLEGTLVVTLGREKKRLVIVGIREDV